MIVQIKRIILLLGIVCLPIETIFSQHSSKNNYTGAWETPTSWSPTWSIPLTNIKGYNITINGYITVNGSLQFSGAPTNLIINDTLVIKGDLTLEDNHDLTINDNGILIVRGNLFMHNHSEITANGYLIITGNIDKHGPNREGSLTSNDNPVKVFIGGSILPANLTQNEPKYPALNCTAPITTRYPHTNCSYGDMTDIKNDPIYPFFQSTCSIATPTITAGGPTTFCNGGSVNLTSSPGTTYLWSNGATTQSIIITSSGIYTVKVTNVSGCLSAASAATIVTVNALPATPTITAGGPTTFCAGGGVTLTSSPDATYLWSNGATTQSINITTAGSYSVRIKNASGCQSAASVATIVTVNAFPPAPTITASGPTTFCAGGSVTLTSSAGSTFLWSTGATTPTINVTTGGNYTVRVTNTNGCQSASSVATTITVNALPATPTITAGGPVTFCAGGNVTLTSSAGTSYLWSTGATTQSIIITTSGSYSVKVINASGCQSSSSAAMVVTVNALPITPTITSGPTTFCAGGSVTLTSSAGTSYLWSNGATTQSINITSSGSYSVKVTNASGCQSASSVPTIVTVNASPVTPTITPGGPTTFCTGGNVTLTSSMGSTYLWSNGATTRSINVITAGNYTVQITNANGCQSAVSAAIIVIVNAVPAVNAGADITIPNGTSTTINATVTGTGPFSYNWSPSSQFVNASLEDPTTVNLASTTIFTLTATSLTTTCYNTDAVTVNITGGPLNSVPTATPLIFCAGATVQLHALASGGSGSYTYTWTSTPGGFTSSLADPIANPVVSTTYHVAINDGFNTVTPQVAVTVNALPATPVITAGGPTTFCAGGSVTLTSSPGTSYIWSNGETTQSINVTSAESYTVQVINVSGCQSALSAATVVTVNDLPVTPTITAGGPTTFCSGGSVTLTSSAGSGYLWSNGATTQSINVSVSGSYTLRVINASGCQSALSVATVVTVDALPTTPTIIADGPTTFCTGGSVTLSSSPETSYLWSNGETTSSIVINATGNYTVKVTNASGCQSAASIVEAVTVNISPLTPTITADGPTTFCDGSSVTLSSSAGSTYLWSNGATTTSINVNLSGSYAVRVTNVSGCQSALSAPVVVTVNALPATPTILSGGPTTFCNGGNVTLTSSAEASYLWSNSATTQTINATIAGSYTVQVKNASGCLSQVSVPTIITVNVLPPVPTVTAESPTTFCDGDIVTLTSSPGIDYLWSNGATTQSVNITSSGSYTVKLSNASGCKSTPSLPTVVTVNTLPLTTAGYNGPVCAGTALSLTGGPSGMTIYYWTGPDEFTSLLQNPSVSDSTTLDMAGLYTLTVFNANGCSNSTTQSVIVNETPISVPGPDQDLKYTFETLMNAELSASETGVWSLISGSGKLDDIHSPTTRITELFVGENKFLWKVLNGNCEDTAAVNITVFDVFIPSVITPNNDGKNDNFRISEFSGKVKLIIINRWGNEEYRSDNYLNDWDGSNNRGAELPNDTYFYILKFDNGNINKGSVLIKR